MMKIIIAISILTASILFATAKRSAMASWWFFVICISAALYLISKEQYVLALAQGVAGVLMSAAFLGYAYLFPIERPERENRKYWWRGAFVGIFSFLIIGANMFAFLIRKKDLLIEMKTVVIDAGVLPEIGNVLILISSAIFLFVVLTMVLLFKSGEDVKKQGNRE